MNKPESALETHEIVSDFEVQTDHLIMARRPDLVLLNKKKLNCRLVDFDILADHKVKIKESENISKYLDLAVELKNLWNMRVTVIPSVIDVLGMVPKDLGNRLNELEIKGRIKTIQTTVLFRSTKILRKVLETYYNSDNTEKPKANTDVKNTHGVSK